MAKYSNKINTIKKQQPKIDIPKEPEIQVEEVIIDKP